MRQTADIALSPGVRLRGLALPLSLAALFVAGSLVQFPLPLNHDAAWHLETAFRVLAGERFGAGVYDVNPPMSAWLFVGSAWFSTATGLPPALVFKLFVFAVMAAALAAAARLLPRAAPEIAHTNRALMLLAFALVILPGYDFGQREHFVAAFVLPYVLLAAGRGAGLRIAPAEAVLYGVIGALGIGFKPYFLAVPFAVEAWLLARSRRPANLLRPEMLAMAAIGALYLAAVWIFARPYLTRIVPDAMLTYGAFKASWWSLAQDIGLRCGPFAIAAALAVHARRAARPAAALTPAMATAAAAALGFLVAAILQRKGWAYQFDPVNIYLVFLVGLVAADPARGARPFSSTVLAAALAVVAGLAPVLSFVRDGYSPHGSAARVHALRDVFEKYAGPNRMVYGFITSPRDVHPAVVAAGVHWASASGVLVFLPAMLRAMAHPGPEDAAIMAIGTRHNRRLVAALEAHRPGVVVVDAAPVRLAIPWAGFDYLKFFARYPGFARFFRHYREVKPVGDFRVFVRADLLTRAR